MEPLQNILCAKDATLDANTNLISVVLRVFKYWLQRAFPRVYSVKSSTIRALYNSFTFCYNNNLFDKIKSLEANSKIVKQKSKTNILFYSVRQDPLHTVWNYVISSALKQRGHKVKVISCDGLIKNGCNEGWYPSLSNSSCKQCYKFVDKALSNSNLDLDYLGDYTSLKESGNWLGGEKIKEWKEAVKILNDVSLEDYESFIYEGIELKTVVRDSVTHFLRVENYKQDIKINPHSQKIFKDFLIAAIMMINISKRILIKNKPEVIVMLNGRFMAERVLFEIAKKQKIRVVVYETGLMPDTMVFVHNEYIDYRNLGDWEKYKNIELNVNQEEKVHEYLVQRIAGAGQAHDYWKHQEEDKLKIMKALNLDSSRAVAVLFPNVLWDSALQDINHCFINAKEWIKSTIQFFSLNRNLQLIIRIHPAELYWPGTYRDSLEIWIKEKYGNRLPSNIKIVSAKSDMSSYTLMKLSDVGIVANSTTGLEMALMGKPVIVTEKAHYWGRGFTLDPMDEDGYHKVIKDVMSGKVGTRVNTLLAKRYFYYIFFRASLKLKYIYSNNLRKIPPILNMNSLSELMSGNDSNLDAICDGILSGKPFIN